MSHQVESSLSIRTAATATPAKAAVSSPTLCRFLRRSVESREITASVGKMIHPVSGDSRYPRVHYRRTVSHSTHTLSRSRLGRRPKLLTIAPRWGHRTTPRYPPGITRLGRPGRLDKGRDRPGCKASTPGRPPPIGCTENYPCLCARSRFLVRRLFGLCNIPSATAVKTGRLVFQGGFKSAHNQNVRAIIMRDAATLIAVTLMPFTTKHRESSVPDRIIHKCLD